MSQAANRTLSASFRGVPGCIQSTSMTGGFKVAEHLYPGSNNFNIEQLGRFPNKFSITWKVNSENKDAFEVALNTAGPGILVISTRGRFLVKVNGEYTATDSQDRLGIFQYTVPFAKELGLNIPSLSTIGTAAISGLRSAGFASASAGLQSGLSSIGF